MVLVTCAVPAPALQCVISRNVTITGDLADGSHPWVVGDCLSCLPVCLSACLFCLSVCLFFFLSVCFVFLSAFLSTCFIYLPVSTHAV